jgi:hypothetical protein
VVMGTTSMATTAEDNESNTALLPSDPVGEVPRRE